MTHVCICICTHNRTEDVASCLPLLTPQLAGRPVEVLVVDSGSNAAEAEKLKALVAGSGPGIRLVRSDVPGLSIARNTGIDSTSAEWIAFLDDDTLPFPDYCDALTRAAARMPVEVAFFGGRLKPHWPGGTPRDDLPAIWRDMLSIIDDPSRRDGGRAQVYGANAIYRLSALRSLPMAFDPSLGREGDLLLSGEEFDLNQRLAHAGFQWSYAGDVGVEHKISEVRLTWAWIRQRAFWDGVTQVYLWRKRRSSLPVEPSAPRNLAKLARNVVLARLGRSSPETRIRNWQSIGIIAARLGSQLYVSRLINALP